MNKLKGKVAVVTGASKGIGASIAEHLAAEGASVVVNYASSKAGADAVVKRITDKGGKAIAVQADVSKPPDIRRLFAETRRAYEGLDVLVNNAGIYEFTPLESVTPEHFHKLFDLNVLGLLLTTQEAVKLIGAEGGSIINISSAAGPMPLPTASVYSATKAAVDAITIALSRELGPKKILVTGATSGIGRAASLQLARRGARVVMVGRDRSRTESALADVVVRSSSKEVSHLICDFSSQAAIRELAEMVRARHERLHVLVNNAGGVNRAWHLTVDGIEATFAVNHLGPFLLTNLLGDLLVHSAPARVV